MQDIRHIGWNLWGSICWKETSKKNQIVTSIHNTTTGLKKGLRSIPIDRTVCAVLFLCLCFSYTRAGSQPIAKQGVLDLRQVNFSRQDAELRGEWKWYWNQLRIPGNPESPFAYTTFPQLWTASDWGKKRLGSQGFATYSLTVLLPQRSVPLMLEVPDQYTAYRLFVNGEMVAHDGNPASTADSTTAHWSTQLIQLPASSDTLQLLLQIANFQHAKGGSAKALRIGEASRLQTRLEVARALDLFLTGCVFMAGLFFIGLFGFSQTDRPMLYFGLFCLVYSYRIIGTDLYVLHTLMPTIPWALSLRLEYASLYLAVALFVVYTQSLYPNDTDRRITIPMAWICLAFVSTVLILPPLLFTQLMDPFLVLMVLYIGYAFFVYSLAARRKRPGAQYSLLSTALLMVVFSLILGQYFGVEIPDKFILFVGYVGFFYLQSLVLSFRFAHALNEARLTEKQFLANMSHEIRTPLNAILGFSSLLETTALTAEQKEFNRDIGTAGKNLLTIVNDILDIAKIESGMLPLETIPFSIPSLVDSIKTMLLPTASDKKLDLRTEIASTIPPVLLGDPTRLTQILLNLLSNAIKFTKEGSVQLRIENSPEANNSVRVRFIVEDTGIGIDSDVLPHIFERFRQANDSTTRQYGGTGLGLSIVRSLAQMQGGWVTVTSTPGKGSCFTVEIPYRIAQDAVGQPIGQPSSSWGLAEHELRILVVEDNRMNQKLMLGVLKRLGYTAQIAENGQQAIDKLMRESFDLVLMDIQMPVMDGYTATRHIRTVLQMPIPIIAMTAHALASEREQCLRAGMNDFLSKPFLPDDLQRLIQKYVPATVKPDKPVESEPAPSTPANHFSVNPLLESVGNDKELALELLNVFLAQTPDQLATIRRALVENDTETIGKIVHTQKAAIQMLGLQDISLQISELEAHLVVAQPLPKLIPLVRKYMQSLKAAMPIIQAEVESMTRRPPV
ncbi:ATP-binding protein [Spirosoma sp. SC4-14]|uniref:hybrid sensor histidine kinase/response regulator n=1 Tax=Spirosoma sp. SC4-14 TaxID=3128900 RepID=UPI0030D35BDE